jgi:hypothetical protein
LGLALILVELNQSQVIAALKGKLLVRMDFNFAKDTIAIEYAKVQNVLHSAFNSK